MQFLSPAVAEADASLQVPVPLLVETFLFAGRETREASELSLLHTLAAIPSPREADRCCWVPRFSASLRFGSVAVKVAVVAVSVELGNRNANWGEKAFAKRVKGPSVRRLVSSTRGSVQQGPWEWRLASLSVSA